MVFKINEKEVAVNQLKDKNDKLFNRYTFKAFSNCNDGGNDSWQFFEKEFETNEMLKDDRKTACSVLFYELTANSSWDLVNGRGDQWGCISLRNYMTSDEIYIEFDYFEHGLLAAYLIVKQLNPEDF